MKRDLIVIGLCLIAITTLVSCTTSPEEFERTYPLGTVGNRYSQKVELKLENGCEYRYVRYPSNSFRYLACPASANVAQTTSSSSCGKSTCFDHVVTVDNDKLIAEQKLLRLAELKKTLSAEDIAILKGDK